MPRIYRPVGPSANKAIDPVKEIKTPEKPKPPVKTEKKKVDGEQ